MAILLFSRLVSGSLIKYFTFWFKHSYVIRSMFNEEILYGYVKFFAIFYGIPTSLRSKFGSGLITVLAEKSTLFPNKFCLNLPYFPFNLSEILLIFLSFIIL